MTLFIAGDIGGTNSRLQLLRVGSQARHAEEKQRGQGEVMVAQHTYPSQEYASMQEIIELFLKQYKPATEDVYCMCLAVAGPVEANTAKITNVQWRIDGPALEKHFRMENVTIINDFEGIGYGLLALDSKQLEAVYTPMDKEGKKPLPVPPTAPKAVIGAGTGLGECYLTHNGSVYNVIACEGGHADFAPRSQLEFDIAQHILRTTPAQPGSKELIDRVSVERVCSGLGIPKIYEYLVTKRGSEANKTVLAAARVEKADVGRIVAEAAKAGSCPLCIEAMDIFTSAYGAEAGNLALKFMPFGGLYIAGGIAGKNMQIIRKNNQFVNNFLAKGRMRDVLRRMPIYLINFEGVGMLGSKVICRRTIFDALEQNKLNMPLRAKL